MRSPRKSDEVVIYHNPRCGSSRKTLELLRSRGIEPRVVEYLKTPPSRDELVDIAARAGVSLSGLLRQKEPVFADLDLGRDGIGVDDILDALEAHPILLNRPIVVTVKGARVCRPPEVVLEVLPELDRRDG